jgi:predicted DNA-binding antitoxin AbrB/MazE fold protein
MSQEFDAIYENGVFRPLKPVGFREHEIVSISVTPSSDDAASLAVATEQRAALLSSATKMEAIVEDLPEDDATNRDHDRIIYGNPS